MKLASFGRSASSARILAFFFLGFGLASGILAQEAVHASSLPLVFKDFLLLESERAERGYLRLNELAPEVLRYHGGLLPDYKDIRNPMLTFKTSFVLDNALSRQDLALYLGLMEYPYHIYLNGISIFASGRYQEGHYNSSQRTVQSVFLSRDILKWDGSENDLFIEAYPQHERWGLDKVYIDYKTRVDWEVFLRNFVGVGLVQGAFALILIIMIYFVALFFIYGRKRWFFLIFAFICASFCLSYINITLYYDTNNEVLLEAISKAGLTLMATSMLVFCLEYSKSLGKRHLFSTLILAIGLGLAFLVLRQTSKEGILAQFSCIMNFFIAPSIAADVGILLFSLLFQKKRFVLPILLPFAVVFVTAGSDMMAMNTSTLPYVWLTAYGFLSILAGILFVLLKELNDMNLATVKLHAELENKIREEAIRERLNESEYKYKELLEQAPEGIFILDQQGGFLLVNSEFCRMTGYEKGEILNLKIQDTYPDESTSSLGESFVDFRAKSPLRFERMMKRRDGRLFPIEISMRDLPNGQRQGIVRDVSQWREAENRLRLSLEEKEVLLRELHHRVKNNLQIISSILALEKPQCQDEQSQELIHDTQARIQSMASLHELLYKSENDSAIEIANYLENIANELERSYFENGCRVRIEAQYDILCLDDAMPVGLIATELISNACKYAYSSGHPGEIFVGYRHEEDQAWLEVRDEGRGMDPRIFEEASTIGYSLIRALSEQLHAQLEIGQVHPGSDWPGLRVVLGFRPKKTCED